MADRAAGRLFRSLSAKLVLLLVVLLAVPWMIYNELRAADAEKRLLLLKTVQEQGRLIARGLQVSFRHLDRSAVPDLNATLANFGVDGLHIKVLYRPVGNGADDDSGFYYVAAWPPLSEDYRHAERERVVGTGMLRRLHDSCEGEQALATHYLNPAGRREVLTSLTPIRSPAGCWVVITSHPSAGLLGISTQTTYWRSPEVRMAASVYLAMSVLVISQFLVIWVNLRRFAQLARRIGTKVAGVASFRALNRVPELDTVAEEFDRLVARLRKSADDIRLAAEERAHALKTPVAVVTQAVEPLRRALPPGDAKARRALELIETALGRLDTLISAGRESDQAAAALIEVAAHPLELGAFLEEALSGYAILAESGRLVLRLPGRSRVVALGDRNLLATVMENVIENALGFSPVNGRVVVSLTRRGRQAEIVVEDEGPGVAADRLEAVFERYYSHRPEQMGRAGPHLGLGLWIARRNVEALGGTVSAENGTPCGLRIVVRLPLVP